MVRKLELCTAETSVIIKLENSYGKYSTKVGRLFRKRIKQTSGFGSQDFSVLFFFFQGTVQVSDQIFLFVSFFTLQSIKIISEISRNSLYLNKNVFEFGYSVHGDKKN